MTHPAEVEEVVKAIAVHVKTELRTAKDEINRVNERIERRSKDIEDKIQLLENKILTGKTAAPADIINKISELEKKLAAPSASNVEKMLDEKINKKLKEIEDKSSVSKSGTDISDELADLRSRLESMKTPTEVSLSALEKKISSGSNKNLQNIESKIETLETTLNNLQKSQQEFKRESAALVSIKKKLQDISGKHEIPSVVIDKLAEFENRVSSVSETVNADLGKISELENKVMSIPEELESRIDEKLNERLSEISSEINQVNQRISSFSAPALDNSKEIDSLRSQVDQVKGSKQRLDSIENTVKSEIQRLEESMKRISHPEERKIEEYSSKLESIRTQVEKKIAEYSSKMESMKNEMEKNHQESEKRSTQAGKELGKEFEQKLGQINDIDKRIGSIEEDLKIIHRTEKDVEEGSVIMASVDKKMADLELFSKDMQAQIEYMKSVENKLEKSLDSRATKMFTKQLEDMSRIMDKRFPTLVTREDVSRHISEINKRLGTIETPDMSPLTEKVDYLEKKVEAIYNMLKSVSSRIPVIVE